MLFSRVYALSRLRGTPSLRVRWPILTPELGRPLAWRDTTRGRHPYPFPPSVDVRLARTPGVADRLIHSRHSCLLPTWWCSAQSADRFSWVIAPVRLLGYSPRQAHVLGYSPRQAHVLGYSPRPALGVRGDLLRSCPFGHPASVRGTRLMAGGSGYPSPPLASGLCPEFRAVGTESGSAHLPRGTPVPGSSGLLHLAYQ